MGLQSAALLWIKSFVLLLYIHCTMSEDSTHLSNSFKCRLKTQQYYWSKSRCFGVSMLLRYDSKDADAVPDHKLVWMRLVYR